MKEERMKPMSETDQSRPRKRVLLRELLKNDQPVWVRNGTSKIAKRYKVKPGCVVFQVGAGENRGKVVIPAGRDPVCISDQVDVDSLKSCRNLFHLIDVGTLELLDPNYCDKYYAQNEVRREVVQKKIDNMRFNVQDAKAEPAAVMKTEVAIDSAILNIVLQLKKGVIELEAALERLNECAGSFDEDSLQYLQANGKYKEIKVWARRELKALEA
jgi:hypothetical protein